MIDWCNEQGGINGREVKGNYYDAKILDVNNAMTNACSQVFMLVGQGWSLDSSQEATRLGCNMASVPTYSVSPAFANGKLMVQPVPNPIDYTPVRDRGGVPAGVPGGDHQVGRDVRQLRGHRRHQGQGAGVLPEVRVHVPARLRPGVQHPGRVGLEALRAAPQGLRCRGRVLHRARRTRTSRTSSTPPRRSATSRSGSPTPTSTTRRSPSGTRSGNADNVYVRQAFIPLEEAAQNPATQQYLDIVNNTGGDVNQLGMQATSAFLLWATAAKELRLHPHQRLRDGPRWPRCTAGPVAASTPRPIPVPTCRRTAVWCSSSTAPSTSSGTRPRPRPTPASPTTS